MDEAEIVLIADPRVVAITINETGNSLVDLRDADLIAYDPIPLTEGNTCYTKMRDTVYEKLCLAQSLLPNGIRLCLYEGWRSLEQQEREFDCIFRSVSLRHPDWSREACFVETTKLVSPVRLLNGELNVPPHSTGAAVDVYLMDLAGEPLDTRQSIAGNKHVAISDFSLVSLISNHDTLLSMRTSKDGAERRVIERMLKTAAAVDTVLRHRGAYKAR